MCELYCKLWPRFGYYIYPIYGCSETYLNTSVVYKLPKCRYHNYFESKQLFLGLALSSTNNVCNLYSNMLLNDTFQSNQNSTPFGDNYFWRKKQDWLRPVLMQ